MTSSLHSRSLLQFTEGTEAPEATSFGEGDASDPSAGALLRKPTSSGLATAPPTRPGTQADQHWVPVPVRGDVILYVVRQPTATSPPATSSTYRCEFTIRGVSLSVRLYSVPVHTQYKMCIVHRASVHVYDVVTCQFVIALLPAVNNNA